MTRPHVTASIFAKPRMPVRLCGAKTQSGARCRKPVGFAVKATATGWRVTRETACRWHQKGRKR